MAAQAKISKVWVTLDNKWYDELKVISPYREFQYDKIIQSHLKTLFPEYYTVYYDKTIKQSGHDEGSRPDFAMVRKDFKEWWIVEVERIEDKLKNVEVQIKNFTNGEYNAHQEAKYLEKNANGQFKLYDILKLTEEIPRVMLIVDDINSKWEETLRDLKPTTCILKVFRNKKGLELYSISGDYPYIFESESHCHFSDAMSNLLKIVNPDVLGPKMKKEEPKSIFEGLTAYVGKTEIAKYLMDSKIVKYLTALKGQKKVDEVFSVTYKGQLSFWKKIEDSGEVYLQPLGPISTRVNDSYVIKRIKENSFILELT